MKNNYFFIFFIILLGCDTETQTKKAINYNDLIFNNQKLDNAKKYSDFQDDLTTRIEVDTTRITFVEKNYNSIVNNKLNKWTDYYKKKCPNFNINEFNQCNIWFLSPYMMNIEEYTDEQKFIKLYKNYLIWNADSTKAIDLCSNDLMLDFDSLGNITEDRDVDPHFALMDFTNKKRIVLWQMGAISVFEEGFWLDDNNLIITVRWTNFEDSDNESFAFNLSYYLVNLTTYQINEFCSKQTYRIKNFN